MDVCSPFEFLSLYLSLLQSPGLLRGRRVDPWQAPSFAGSESSINSFFNKNKMLFFVFFLKKGSASIHALALAIINPKLVRNLGSR